MEYKVKIIAEDGSEILFGYVDDEKSTIKKVAIMFDTLDDNVYRKGSGMLARMTIEGAINDNGIDTDQLIGLFNWSKSEESEEQYRTVEVEIWNGTTRHRVYHFERMFVVDYHEIYSSGQSGKDSSQDATKFVLKLTQQENKFKAAKTFK
jgi:hypothetical protein